jgi:pyruvate kinase
VCTIGPASARVDRLEALIGAGMSVARLNFAHGQPEEHREAVARIRAASKTCGRPVAILQDLAGPKLRLGEVDGGRLLLEPGQEIVLASGRAKAGPGLLAVPDPHLAGEVRIGHPILIGDGAVELEVVDVTGAEIRCRTLTGGEVSTAKGINVPGGLSARPILDGKGLDDLELGAELGVDLVGVSYVRTADDLTSVRRHLRGLGRPTPLVAKIETGAALERIDEILAHSDGVMIARGDLSLEIPYERVPVEQKRIVQRAIRAGRPVITATQMLQSMVSAARPTRAETADVANAVLDGTDAVMLSDETALGIDPVRACRTMARIVEETQAAFPDFPEPDLEGIPDGLRELAVFSRDAVRTARDVGAIAIVTWSRGGLAARLLSRQRPSVPILAPTRFEETWRRLSILFGVRPVYCPAGRMTREQLRAEIPALSDHALLLAVGHHPGEQQRIPWMGLARVGDTQGWGYDPRPESGPPFSRGTPGV